jgi:poly(ribitol-phosphate) beta-N-acetylglucosaminyltransferase
MNTPLVSFCVPTHNRARYLESLLGMLAQQLAGFPYSYEVFVSDNASTDATPDVLARHRDTLPLRWVRQQSNRGGPGNWQYVMSHAQGTYLVYVADDDAILGDQVAATVARMEADPQIGIAYAPWMFFDLVRDKPHGQFYQQDRDLCIAQGDHAALLDGLLRFNVFPEIYVCRSETLKKVMPRINEQAFYAFVHAAEFAQHGAVLLQKDPFYVSITNYFADEQRSQAGSTEAEYAWDRYRGGLEYVLGRASERMSSADRLAFSQRIQHLIAQRISVAVRLRNAQGRDPVETYYLAYRLKAMGEDRMLPMPMAHLRGQAALGFLATDPELNRDMSQLICVGHFQPDVQEFLRRQARVPVRFEADGASLVDARDALVFAGNEALLTALPQRPDLRVVHERELLQKFPG